MTSAIAVANEFLELARYEPSVPPIDQMKLQKLLFYGHAWSLGITGQPLFEEDFEAWPWGPVVRDVYSQTVGYGRQPVTAPLRLLQPLPQGGFGFDVPRIEDQKTKEFIRSVWDSHKQFTGIQLSNATHAPGEPWTLIKQSYSSLESKPTIPNEIIRNIFTKKVQSAANVS